MAEEEFRNPNPGEHVFLKLFQDKITYNGKIVPVLTEFYHDGNIPSICILMTGGAGQIMVRKEDVMLPLPQDHPHYDANNPDALYKLKERTIKSKPGTAMLIIWSPDKDGRQIIHNQMMDIIDKALNFHYSCCSKYNNTTEVCSETGQQCDALTVKNAYSEQGKCPYLNVTEGDNYRDPKTWMEVTGVSFNKESIRPEDIIDETNFTPPTHRINQLIDCWIGEVSEVDVIPLCGVKIDDIKIND